MKSAHISAEQAVQELGDKVVEALAIMTAQTREDLRVYRATFPGWASDATDRGLPS